MPPLGWLPLSQQKTPFFALGVGGALDRACPRGQWSTLPTNGCTSAADAVKKALEAELQRDQDTYTAAAPWEGQAAAALLPLEGSGDDAGLELLGHARGSPMLIRESELLSLPGTREATPINFNLLPSTRDPTPIHIGFLQPLCGAPAAAHRPMGGPAPAAGAALREDPADWRGQEVTSGTAAATTFPEAVAADEIRSGMPPSRQPCWGPGLPQPPLFCMSYSHGVEGGPAPAPGPPASVDAPPSRGSLGHPDTCGLACKYAWRARGCKEALACPRCHICRWRRAVEKGDPELFA